ncbi:cytochrome c nitrate reductase biogenesis protein NrfE [Haemophilus parainfluenzae ATCC 33392]|uniref:Heme lyase NrfEFG subunit NrfE n=1 Tax=Haemophilus parainfluenzae ATCC 33392 TaxID=888828 RepID=A0ABD7ZDZ6_HAEPA|nr:heme lyase NrfEFG subunit NrfE [Haemophilus parainfluenzae]EGC72621.1 cytochrome c nitrate reductase biogenesis protein NrfE [Haemophilus parainfluenzae ATCC 33392]KFL98419.1 cytochrome c nitrate reductase biogenesis protein NrfE [Haemophilus parainfluenzae ATCC 33392]QQB23360.1 heme lyase NrfEFG subunit NrfE [Haemophilus parainfluenzae]WMS23135.1 heme lyase NrfEFG subunit NrfE [Haemophilus parainfluenzae ATCC 33392]STO94239.1 Cytochrome c-type biogenesis protein CcmF [Haemophilus parainflu
MLPELGFLSLLFATTAALLLSIVPQIGIWRNKPTLTNTAWGLSYCFGIFTSVSIGILAYSFATDDFTLEYVAAHSNSQLPTFFKVAATWGGHEGSILFWLFTLSLWLVAFAFFSRKNDRTFSAQTLSLLGLICLGFAIFILFYSNPFGRAFPAPVEGRDLNPMLQDIGLIFHPPLLYVGYVGFAVNFAMSISALIFNRSAQAIARAMRAWVLVSWLFLTLGIVLGAWWAYYELGWGGWWFWDPVENASLMPWLLGLALLHSLMVTEKQGMFSYWTILFSLLAFAFSVLGTFIVRSGALTSVHAFALDSSRGYVLLLIFFLLTVGSLSLFALRTNTNESAVKFPLISKTGAILGLNIVLTVATVSTFLGTFYPMLFQAMNWGSISVGAPYFNSIFLPLLTLVLFAMAGTLCLNWFQSDKKRFFKRLLLLIPAAVITYGMIWNALQNDSALRFYFFAYILLTLAIWVLFVTLWQNWAKVRLAYFGMILAHCGVAIATMGAVMSSYFGSELGVRLAPQQSQQLGQFEFHYDRFSNEIGPNFTAEVAFFSVSKQGKPYAEIVPERRYYDVRTMTMSEVGLDASFWGDLYIVMGDNLGKGEFTFRLHYKPLIRWLWLGGILMALGALCSVINLKRKRDE